MGWISQYEEVKTYFVVHIYNNGRKFCEIEDLQKVFNTREEAQEYAKRICEKTLNGYHIEKFCFGKVDLD